MGLPGKPIRPAILPTGKEIAIPGSEGGIFEIHARICLVRTVRSSDERRRADSRRTARPARAGRRPAPGGGRRARRGTGRRRPVRRDPGRTGRTRPRSPRLPPGPAGRRGGRQVRPARRSATGCPVAAPTAGPNSSPRSPAPPAGPDAARRRALLDAAAAPVSAWATLLDGPALGEHAAHTLRALGHRTDSTRVPEAARATYLTDRFEEIRLAAALTPRMAVRPDTADDGDGRRRGSAATATKQDRPESPPSPRRCGAIATRGNTPSRASPRVRTSSRWGGWDSNPRPTDYESAALTG